MDTAIVRFSTSIQGEFTIIKKKKIKKIFIKHNASVFQMYLGFIACDNLLFLLLFVLYRRTN